MQGPRKLSFASSSPVGRAPSVAHELQCTGRRRAKQLQGRERGQQGAATIIFCTAHDTQQRTRGATVAARTLGTTTYGKSLEGRTLIGDKAPAPTPT